jgi:plasmid stabilization system protein ParE
MAAAGELKVLLSARALAALDGIWEWNARRYSVEHAERYIAFLRGATQKLSTSHGSGRPVPNRPHLRYVALRPRRRKGHGHIAVYEVMGDAVYVLDYFHTAQDWQGRLGQG